MADPGKRLPGNVPGDFYVDSSCIDCDQCRRIAPATFRAEGDVSVVRRQPASPDELLRAEMALVACPTASIGTVAKHDLKAAVAAFPEAVADNVHFCGFTSEDSFGASSYLVVRPEGNVLVDSPRFTEPLARRIAAMGGVRWMFLTHVDDVADHAKWRRRFGCDRVMRPGLALERPLGDRPESLAPDLLAIPTPGHTREHAVLLHRRFLFSGDHLWGDATGARLRASRSVCWHSWKEQRRSVELLRAYDFEWVLPGHGPRLRLPAPEMRRALENLVRRMS